MPLQPAMPMVMSTISGHPVVSVVLPFYDPPVEFFRAAIDSVLRQTFAEWELILVNDGSGAAATAVASEYCRQLPDRIRIVAHEHGRNAGLRASRLLGFKHADGRYIALLDADDLWRPCKLQEQVELLDGSPRAGLLYGNSLYWGSWTESGGEDFQPDLGVTSGTLIEPPALVPPLLSGRVAVPCPSSMIARRSSVSAAGAFEGAFQNIYEDQVFLMKMCLASPVLIYPKTWDYYRIHSQSIMGGSSDERVTAARRAFLEWLNVFVEERGLVHAAVRDAIASELWALDHPAWARVKRFVLKRARRFRLRAPLANR